jgi:uncharacterized protein DUF1257
MSAYLPFETEFNDQECLIKALADNEVIKYSNVEVHEQPQNLVGYHGDTRTQKANIIVRRKDIGGASNDIGFLKGENGKFTAIISDFDKGKHNATYMTGLKKSYAAARMHKEARRQGLKFKSDTMVNGKRVVKYLMA